MGSTALPGWRQLSVGVIGGGIGGMSVAVALRCAGHDVTIYERAEFVGEVAASVSCAANGTRWLKEWKVDVSKGDPVILKRLIDHDWNTGELVSVYYLTDFKERWEYVFNMFHRQYMHTMLKETALEEGGEGVPATLLVNHKCVDIDLDHGKINFDHGAVAQHDFIVAADGAGSTVRGILSIVPHKKPCDSTCLYANVTREAVDRLGIINFALNSSLEYWGGQEGKWDRVILSSCNGGNLLSYYCVSPREKGDYQNQSCGGADLSVDELLAPCLDLVFSILELLLCQITNF
ncbi:uncharacterized protein NECHADRAFT_44298 [Fusarium vanettenii 77-13-4]|uniref:FAD-binding domain-containing protein n=1 Tax=Fusarium vanettenii (strain ATCC MYA-4622 / CBS 123669 / FGSC 9596 / NRRL 45880 / 77-13-4) TaxID=660122 RepID=C7ZJM3_FUSV7|nr:uncharacterized protein NECHADRAFT_44298 [Fusarium vanettenii 77-13-4]EEU35796.1 hypothetical protein NECHADRAFT_44298 [Fusarium vanettenii 77-13-4]